MGPLAGVKVIEIAAMGPVPFCGMLLADLGAEVIRVDRPTRAEMGIGKPDRFELRGRNKRSVAIDLKSEAGRALFLRLAAQADVVLEGFRPGVAERLGIGPGACRQVRPGLVYGKATGWGQDGPLAMTAGHDINYIALTGALDMIGPAGGAPVPPLNLVGDYGGGAMFLAFGVLAAVIESRASGQGQVVDAAMVDGVSTLLTVFHGFAAAGQLKAERGGNVLDGGAPYYTTYQAACGGYLAVGAIESRFYATLLERLELVPGDLPDRDDAANWPRLRAILARRFLERSRADWEARFEGSDACVTPVLSLAEAAEHPHNRARAVTRTLDGLRHPSPAPRFSRTPGALTRPPAEAGEHSTEVLRDWGLSAGEIAAHFAEGVVNGQRGAET